jgi:multidrug resistance efflux pump
MNTDRLFSSKTVLVLAFAGLLQSLPISTHANELVLTGQISSSAKQVVVAPQGSRWQVQIQWMEEEGKIVEKGQPVVTFDGASEQAQLTQNQENLDRLSLELEQLVIEQDQRVVDAEGRLTVAKMRVEKAKIEASVPASEVAAYDKGQYELELQRTMLEQVKAEEAAERARREKKAELTKKRLEIIRIQEEIAYLENILSKLNVVAQVTGPVTYALHPWYGEKLSAGMNVRPSWKVVDVQSTSNFQIETWVHEIDAVGLKEQAKVKIVFDAFPNKEFSGTLSSLSRQSERKPQWSKSAYFPAVVSFDSAPALTLLPGMSVRMEINTDREASASQQNSDNQDELGAKRHLLEAAKDEEQFISPAKITTGVEHVS